ncbi:MAG: type II secretion system protein GspK [Synergistaceae bacterium]|nr:type II secretion system protein GspK [Synergistaceae bacterium]
MVTEIGNAGSGIRMRKRYSSKGFILVSVLLLCVMLVASATAYAWFARTQVKTVIQDKSTLQARSVAFLLVREAIRGLKLDTNKFDSPLEEWFQPMLIPLDSYGIANVVLKPLDNKIPLQHLFLPDGTTLRNEMKDLWEKIWVELGERTTLPAKVLDYIDKDTISRPGGRDGPGNLNRNLLDVSELLGMEEMTPQILYGEYPKFGLVDYCTMWSDTKININTIEPHLLALLNGLNNNLAEEIVKFREKKEIASLDDLKGIPSFPSRALPYLMNLVGFTSAYYSLKIELISEDFSSVRYFDIVIHKPTGRILRWEEM